MGKHEIMHAIQVTLTKQDCNAEKEQSKPEPTQNAEQEQFKPEPTQKLWVDCYQRITAAINIMQMLHKCQIWHETRAALMTSSTNTCSKVVSMLSVPGCL